MKVAVIADLQLGARKFRKTKDGMNLYEYLGYAQLEKAYEVIASEEPDVLCIAGDVFEKSDPSNIAFMKFKEFIDRVSALGVECFVVGGNHDFSYFNYYNDSHSFKNVGDYAGVHFVYKEPAVFEYGSVYFTCFPHPPYSEDSKSVDKSLGSLVRQLKSKDGVKVLVTHGVLKSWVDKVPGLNSENAHLYNTVIEDSLAEQFDYVFIGHIHNPIFQKKKGTVVIAPGSLLEEPSASLNSDSVLDGCGVVFIDTESGSVEKVQFEGVKYNSVEVKDYDSLCDALRGVAEADGYHVWHVSYEGDWQEVDQDLYYEAQKNSLALSLVVKSKEVSSKPVSVKDFWGWVDDKYPHLKQEFKAVLSGSSE